MLGTRIVALEPSARVVLMEWCYVVCSHQEVRGTRPGTRPADAADAPAALPAPSAARMRLVPQPAASLEPMAVDATG